MACSDLDIPSALSSRFERLAYPRFYQESLLQRHLGGFLNIDDDCPNNLARSMLQLFTSNRYKSADRKVPQLPLRVQHE